MTTATRVRPEPRIARRRLAVARAKRRRLVIRIAVVATGALLIWIALWSPLLKVRNVLVVGGARTSSADVTAAADLGSDDNILFVSSADVVRAVEDLPWVKTASVDRSLPSTVRVRIVERRPAMLLRTAAGSWTVDKSGYVLQPGAVSASLPVVATTSVGDLEPGDRVSSAPVRAALKGFAAMPRRLARRVEAAFAPAAERLSYALEGDVLVRYGGPERSRDKNEVLAALLERLDDGAEEVGYIDVRVPSSPAIATSPPDDEV